MNSLDEHNAARISSNLLGEYILSDDQRKKEILVDQKYPAPGKKVSYWMPAESAVLKYILGGASDQSVLQDKITVLQGRADAKPKASTKFTNNIEALRRYLSMSEAATFRGFSIRRAERSAYVNINGVRISIRPELVMAQPEKNSFGFVKFRFSKKHFTLDVSEYISLMLTKYAQTYRSTSGILDLDASCVVDVLGEEIFPCSAANTDRWKDIENACVEIAKRWPLVSPRKSRVRILNVHEKSNISG